MQEKQHVNYILGLLKNAIYGTTDDQAPPRLPSYTTLFLAHSLRGVFYPANFIYPLTAHFLMQRPGFDVTDVPMLYNMLYSSSDDWNKERGWILKFLSDAMYGAGDAEWRIFSRRHTWDLLASIWQSGSKDRVLRNGILEVRWLALVMRVETNFLNAGSEQSDLQKAHDDVSHSEIIPLILDGDDVRVSSRR